MVEIQTQLPESVNDFIQPQIAEGRCGSVHDYLGDLARADQQRQDMLSRLCVNEQLEAEIERGLQSGEGRRWTPAVLGELRQQLVQRDGNARNEA